MDKDSMKKTREMVRAIMKSKYNDGWLHDPVLSQKPVKTKKETNEEKTIRILKGDFEKTFDLSFDEFIDIYHNLLEHEPEKLI